MDVYAYTGDRKLLKNHGWIFQKLYAKNYQAYHKASHEYGDPVFMFVRLKMALEIGNLALENQVAYIQFILDNANKPEEFWLRDDRRNAPKFVLTKYGNVISSREISRKRVATLGEENEYSGGEIPFSHSYRNLILELNDIHPLEKIKI